MQTKKIDDKRLYRLVRDGNTLSEIAAKFGVSKSAVSKRLKRLRMAMTREVVIKNAGEIVRRELDMAAQLMKINDSANELLDRLMESARTDDETSNIMETQVVEVDRIMETLETPVDEINRIMETLETRVNPLNQPSDSADRLGLHHPARRKGPQSSSKPADSRNLALRVMREIRGQLGLQRQLFQNLYDTRMVAEFQKAVLDAIGEASPEVRQKIVLNLQRMRAVRSSLEFDNVCK